MLFNSYFFIFLYLPVVLTGFYLLGHWHRFRLAALWLGGASLIFYAYDDPAGLAPIIVASIAFNFVAGTILTRTRNPAILFCSIAANLLALGWFKYAAFMISNLNHIAATTPAVPEVALPIGISFYTFTQIAFLVDAYRGEAREYSAVHYLLFVTFFPHLIAGPILHHKEMMPQFDRTSTYRLRLANLALGLCWFTAGLFKKVVLADGVSRFADPMFAGAAAGQTPDFWDAWMGTLAYAFQLYFDFSGYSDMAIGLGLMFGIRLPINFNSPYKATSLIDFWRRWHITLSRFLRDYLYIPLGGNKRGAVRRYVNVAITMLLGGLWHGASWNFVLWGALHGAGLLVNHWCRDLASRLGIRLPEGVSWMTTFLAVVVAWVPFRADDLSTTFRIWAAMADVSAIRVPALDVRLLWLCVLLALALRAPNTLQIFGMADNRSIPRFQPTTAWAVALGGAFGIALSQMLTEPSAFLYFRF